MTSSLAPGSWCEPILKHGSFDALVAATTVGLVIADQRVLSLHPKAKRAILKAKIPLIALRAGESAKSLTSVERIERHALTLPRASTVLALGGGTIGDVATVFAHLHKRGIELIHVPTTALAAVDSSLGGKGAVNVGGVKNALGVFHYPREVWRCDEFFSTLSSAQLREGETEAVKMHVSLSRSVSSDWIESFPSLSTLIETSQKLKLKVCSSDPYERLGQREVLNLGHTFGHVFESLSKYRVRHGEAVGLGLLCALEVGLKMKVTSQQTASDVALVIPFERDPGKTIAALLTRTSFATVKSLLLADKKGASTEGVKMILLERQGRWVTRVVPWKLIETCVDQWRSWSSR